MGDITLRKALQDYKTVYMAYRNFAERTRVEYWNDLVDLVGFLEKSGINHVKEIGLPIIERYAAHLEQKGFASLTRKRKVVVIRSFLSFLYQDGYIDTNIAKRVVLPFTESTTPYVLTQTECDKIQNACADSPRDVAIIELLLQTGIKLSELVGLTLNDIDLDKTGQKHGFIRITGSRAKKERMIPVNTKARLALENYLDIRKESGSNVLFLNRFDQRLGERGIQKLLRKYLKKVGLERASLNTLRHTFGTHHIAKGANVKTIQEVMGYKDRRSTNIYLSLSQEIAKLALENNSL